MSRAGRTSRVLVAVSAAASALALVPRGGAPERAGLDGDRFGGFVAEATTPPLYIEGQPFMGELTIVAEPGDRPAEVPAHLLEPSGWSLDGKALVRRRAGDARFVLQQGQRLETSIDLAPFIEDRLDGDGRDFRIQFVETARVLEDTVHLALPEAGIDFMELPREQLGGYQVVLDTDGGLIWLELWPEVAPNHVRNFLDLCATGFYDGLVFNRVIPGFMIQGGDPDSRNASKRKALGSGGPGYQIPAEFVDSLIHVKGALAAARRGGPGNPEKMSSGSQFYIVQGRGVTEDQLNVLEAQNDRRYTPEERQAYLQLGGTPFLDNEYTVFGMVVDGLEVIDKIAEVRTLSRDVPRDPIAITMTVEKVKKKKITKE